MRRRMMLGSSVGLLAAAVAAPRAQALDETMAEAILAGENCDPACICGTCRLVCLQPCAEAFRTVNVPLSGARQSW